MIIIVIKEVISMMRIENERLEYKRELTEVVKKEVIAFANTLGGDIYIGIDDDGSVVGVAEPDD
jgi:ATP-dependent DNA helicase RecG